MTKALKIGQVLGVLLMAAGVACVLLGVVGGGAAFVLGGLVYAGCRLTAWLRSPSP